MTTAPRKAELRAEQVDDARLSVAGASSSAGTRRCAVMIARRAGGDRGPERRQRPREQVCVRVDGGQLEVRVRAGVAVAGEVLGAGGDPRRLQPATKAATCRATSCGSAPKERTPMTGLSGSTLTSATGARSRLTPTGRQPAADRRADRRGQLRTSSTAPSARLPG